MRRYVFGLAGITAVLCFLEIIYFGRSFESIHWDSIVIGVVVYAVACISQRRRRKCRTESCSAGRKEQERSAGEA